MTCSRTQRKVLGVVAALWLSFANGLTYAQTGHDASGTPTADASAPDQKELLEGIDKILAHGNLQDVPYISESLQMNYTVQAQTFDNLIRFIFHLYKQDNSSHAELNLSFARSGTLLKDNSKDDADTAWLTITLPKSRCVSVERFDGWSSQKPYRVAGEHSMMDRIGYGLKRTDLSHQMSLFVDTNSELKCATVVRLEEYTGEEK